MDVIIADREGKDICSIVSPVFECEIGEDENTFALTLTLSNYDHSVDLGMRCYIPGTEYGGFISGVNVDTENDEITFSGLTWRGMLSQKLVANDPGSEFKTVYGKISDILESLITGPFGKYMEYEGDDRTERTATYQAPGYCSILSFLDGLMAQNWKKLNFKYVTDNDFSAHVEVGFSASATYDSDAQYIETASSTNVSNRKTTTLIVDYGENVKDAQIVRYYVDQAGNVSRNYSSQYYIGIDEYVDYLSIGKATLQEADQKAKDYFKTNKAVSFSTVEIINTDIEMDVGDSVVLTEEYSGKKLVARVIGKVFSIKGDLTETNYKLSDGLYTFS